MHSAEFKAKVLAQYAEDGASVAAVAMASGLNANMVRRWLVGRGVKRMGLAAAACASQTPTTPMVRVGEEAAAMPAMQFVPVDMVGARIGDDLRLTGAAAVATEAGTIEVELHRGEARVNVRWPTSRADGCAAWLGELASTFLKG